jgi:DNA-binding transcriptional ArsR family regulator
LLLLPASGWRNTITERDRRNGAFASCRHFPKYLSEYLTIGGLGTILKHVLNNVLDPELDLDRVFQALADPGRRRMLERLSEGPASVSELGKPLAMSLAAVLQHVQILEGSGLVQSRKLGRTRTCSLNAETLRSAEQWISERRTFTERRLDRLGAYLASTADQPDSPD